MELMTYLKGCLQKVRTDCGTENVLLAAIQCSDQNTLKRPDQMYQLFVRITGYFDQLYPCD